MADRVVLLFTKPAQPGRVKTRLIGDVTAQEAAELHAAFVADLLDRLDGGDFELQIAWALEDGEQAPTCAFPAVKQEGSDLGERLHHSLARATQEAQTVAAIGSDHPELSAGDLEEAFDLLEGREADVVLGPALDGGYYALAVRREALKPRLFEDIPWSTPEVLEETLNRCDELGLRVHLLRPASDVDTPGDLERLAAALAEGKAQSPAACNLLRAWGYFSEGGRS